MSKIRSLFGAWLYRFVNAYFPEQCVQEEELIHLRSEVTRLEALSETDKLTGLLNRQGEERIVEEIIRILQRVRITVNMSLIIIDLDNFKQVNDGRGHEAGDRVLQIVASLMRSAFRREDRLARLARTGGDEFCVVCFNATPKQAAAAAERLLEKMREHPDLDFEGIGRVSASVGVAAIETSDRDIPAAYHRAKQQADTAMYTAKKAGRDCIFFA